MKYYDGIRAGPVMVRLLTFLALLAHAARADEPSTAAPQAVASIRVYPPALTLDGPRDARRLIVTGLAADGSKVDLTPAATYATGDGLKFGADGFARGRKDGHYTVKVAACGRS